MTDSDNQCCQTLLTTLQHQTPKVMTAARLLFIHAVASSVVQKKKNYSSKINFLSIFFKNLFVENQFFINFFFKFIRRKSIFYQI